MPPAVPALIEPYPIEDEFCSGLACIEDLDGVARFVLYTDQVRYEDDGQPIRVVRKKIVLPLAAIKPGVEMTLGYLARKGIRAAGAAVLRMVKA